MSTLTLTDGSESFEVTVLESTPSSNVVLFAVGAGGNPERHLPLLTALVESKCTVVAPHFDSTQRTDSNRERVAASGPETDPRPQCYGSTWSDSGWCRALHRSSSPARLSWWTSVVRRWSPCDIAPAERLARLVLLAPPTGFFQVGGALDSVRIPILAWAGSQDTITPPIHVDRLAHAMHDRLPVDVRVTEAAGHFSFMDLPPPHSVEPLPDRQAFLDELAQEIRHFLIG